MLKFRLAFALAAGLALAGASYSAPTAHRIKASARPYRAFGHAVKSAAHVVKSAAVTTATFSFAAFDAAVVDPFGVALQGLADGVDMFVAQPLEALPRPFSAVGKGVHYVYLGVDKIGEQLAK